MRYQPNHGEGRVTVAGYVEESLNDMIEQEAEKRGWTKSKIISDALEDRYLPRQDRSNVTVVTQPAD